MQLVRELTTVSSPPCRRQHRHHLTYSWWFRHHGLDLMNKTAAAPGPSAAGRKAVKTRVNRTADDHAAGRSDLHRRLLQLPDRGRRYASVTAITSPAPKLAPIIDATAAPVCMIAPCPPGLPAVSGYVNSGSVSGIEMFIKQILELLLPDDPADDRGHLSAEYRFRPHADPRVQRPRSRTTCYHSQAAFLKAPSGYQTGSRASRRAGSAAARHRADRHTCIVGLIYTGGYYDAESEYVGDFMGAFSSTSSVCESATVHPAPCWLWCSRSLLLYFGAIGARVAESVHNGFIQMISPILILTFAWTLLRSDPLQHELRRLRCQRHVQRKRSGQVPARRDLHHRCCHRLRHRYLLRAPSASWLPLLCRCSIMIPSPFCAPSVWRRPAPAALWATTAPPSRHTIAENCGALSPHQTMCSLAALICRGGFGVTFVGFILAGLIQAAGHLPDHCLHLMVATLLVIKAISSAKKHVASSEMAEAIGSGCQVRHPYIKRKPCRAFFCLHF